MITNGPQSLESALKLIFNDRNLKAVHRLDKDTSGCVILSKNQEIHEALISLFQKRNVVKLYHAIVQGSMRQREFSITQTIDDQTAESKVRRLDSNYLASHLLVSISTGRTHQIRKHLQGIGHPVLGDSVYFKDKTHIPDTVRPERQMLHASKLMFRHPVTDVQVIAEAPLPPDFRRYLRALKLS
jgi:23S rRNA pseudouridine1911/1915/1917 synthase